MLIWSKSLAESVLPHIHMEQNNPSHRSCAVLYAPSTTRSPTNRAPGPVIPPSLQDGMKPLHRQALGGLQLPEVDPASQHAGEERRLAHVAATRPRLRHVITYVRWARIKGQAVQLQRSSILEGVLAEMGGIPALRFEVAEETPAEAELAAQAEWQVWQQG